LIRQIAFDIETVGANARRIAAGPVVIPFTGAVAGNSASGVATVDRALLTDLLANPSNYYMNVHTTAFPGGAIRGQLLQQP